MTVFFFAVEFDVEFAAVVVLGEEAAFVTDDDGSTEGHFSTAEFDDIGDDGGLRADGIEGGFWIAVIPPEFEGREAIALGELEADARSEGVGFGVNLGGHFALDLGRVAELEGAEGHVDGVAGHVAERAGAEVGPAAPFERVVEAFFVGAHLSGADEAVPVEAIGDGVGAGGSIEALGPDGAVRPDVKFFGISDDAGLDDLD